MPHELDDGLALWVRGAGACAIPPRVLPYSQEPKGISYLLSYVAMRLAKPLV